MRTYGTVMFAEKFWVIQCEPHVMIKAKAIFPRADKKRLGVIAVKHSPEVCHEILWFCDRYPLELKNRELLERGRQFYLANQEMLFEMLAANYVPTTPGLAEPLRHYQSVFVDVFTRKGGGILLADQLGLGKTVSAIGVMASEGMLPAAVVCQAHLPKQWKGFLARFMPQLKVHIVGNCKTNELLEKADVYILSYHKLWAWTDVIGSRVNLLVFDECQELRKMGSQKYEAAVEMRSGVKHCIGLSGTPIYNYGGEMFNVMDVLQPGCLGEVYEFQREWCEGSRDQCRLVEPEAFASYLKEQFLMMLRTRQEVGRELPPLVTVIETIDYRREALQLIDGEATRLAHTVLKGAFAESGQAARELDMKLRQATGIAKSPYVADFVAELVKGGEQVVLCGWHRLVYEVWKEELTKRGIPFSFYTGEETSVQKNKSVTDFVAGTSKVFIMSLRSGVGLDGLQQVSKTIVFGELDWSPGVHEQCRGRIFRDGQAGQVTEVFLMSDAGSDPIVAEVLGLKKAQISGIIDPKGASGLKSLQTETGRVKKMAEDWIARRQSPDPQEIS